MIDPEGVTLGHGRCARAPAATLPHTATKQPPTARLATSSSLCDPTLSAACGQRIASTSDMPMPTPVHELRLVLGKLVSHPPDNTLPGTLLEITQELISLCSLEDQLHSYVKERRTCLLAGALCFSTTAPIHVVPAEILLDIFFFAIALDDGDAQHLSSDPLRWGTLPISHVCRQWRTLALGTSALWTRITFDTVSRGLRPLYIKRAREQPLDLICTDDTIESQASTRELNDVLKRCRTRSLSWRIEKQLHYNLLFGRLLVLTEQDLLHFHLSLSAQHKSLRPPWTPHSQRWCQSLRSLTLENACPSILPSCSLPELRTASLSYPPFTTGEQPENFRVSQLQDLVRASPRLIELAIHRNPPILDIDLAQVVSGSTQGDAELHTLTWTSAPARDVWMLFHILAMPRLTELVLALDTMDRRWLYFSGDILTPPSYYNLALHGFPQAIRLPLLTYLRVDCKDTEALSSAFRRISFPSLEHLVLSYSGRASTAPTLPPASRLFRDPRLVKLAYLEIRHFTLDAETLATLAYMQSLTTLSLYACPGTSLHDVPPLPH